MKNQLKNPIIPGYYPDPSICCVGDDYYLACSSFEMCPGLPIFHSKDLAHWEQICNAMTAENGLHVERQGMVGGLMAPTIRYNNGIFYLICCNFCDKGNFIITAKEPGGPWSQPHWLDDVPGIDASIFFDDDGQSYIMGTGDVWDNGAGVKERGIWLAKYDIENFKMAGKPVTIFNSALRVGASPEAPHLYHIGGYYYLIIAEGGTEHYHAVMAARSKVLFGFYEGNPANPVLTHRHFGFKSPIINVGHADLVKLPDGSWYAVMLASRLIDGAYKNLGRETFICPVVWERDWPLFSPETGKVEWAYDAPECLPWTEYPPEAVFDDFDEDGLGMPWVFWGTPYGDIYDMKDSKVILNCIPQSLAEKLQPMGTGLSISKTNVTAFIARRQRKISATSACRMSFMPEGIESAGMAVIQAMNHELHVERAVDDGQQVLRVILVTSEYECPPYMPGFTSTTEKKVIQQVPWDDKDIILQIQMDGEDWTVRYGKEKDDMQELCKIDGALINPEKVGCMTGTLIGMYATGNGKESGNKAEFDWFEMK